MENRLAAFLCKKQQKYNFFERDRFFLFCYNKIIGNCSEPTSKMLRILEVWRIRQIKFQKQS